MSDEVEVKEKRKPGPKPKPAPSEFKNTTRHNIFTEAGRCSPGNTVVLSPDNAAKYVGLESV